MTKLALDPVDLAVPSARLSPFFTAAGDRFVVPTVDGSLSLWDAATRQRIDVALPHSPVGLANLAPDGSLVIGVAEPAPGAMFWDIDSATEIRTVTLEDFPLDMEINAYEISSDGSMLAVSEDRGQVFVWDLATGRRRGNPADRPGAARGIAFAPGTATLVIAAATGEMTLYDLATEQAVGDEVVPVSVEVEVVVPRLMPAGW
jgi:WD40 repeat protein